MRRPYIAIDPGKSGAIVVRDNNQIIKFIIPTDKSNAIDLLEVANIFDGIRETYRGKEIKPLIAIEDVHSIFGTGAKSNFQFGRSLGIVEALSYATRFPVHRVSPKKWQKEVWENSDKVYDSAKTPGGKKKLNTKNTSLIACKRLFPNQDLTKSERAKKPHDGIVDALLITEYCVRLNM